ncbi:MarR family winged helix-turn-helix transcriptional regulator [Devosia ginsengisoli]|uniref:MarR family winged helix-turn-helix transcriptional regulator n=1 Tax=Devosia ginsengisoli TaxID=400770 RepID=UPI0026F34060|nr:MarR family winged helix-turn-helix transcriptional regulator [Devosia ginsengisoli]MCR6671883.1 MarR family winged helix-turn-helix transcriptional regulator [Devosia ginsengisoli]
MSRESVQNTHIKSQLRQLHGALLDIVSVMNRPQRDDALIHAAGIKLDRALFPLLVGIGRLGPVGVVDLADRVGRDYTTVSRQIGKLEMLGLVLRQESATDRRVKEAVVSAQGRAMLDALDAARERMGSVVFQNWPEEDLAELVRLMRKFADTLLAEAD